MEGLSSVFPSWQQQERQAPTPPDQQLISSSDTLSVEGLPFTIQSYNSNKVNDSVVLRIFKLSS